MNLPPNEPLERVQPLRRRGILYGGVAVAAAVAGSGYAWWKLRPHEPGPDAAVDAFWRLSFETPTGALLPAASLKNKPLLINFWATWCPPCVEELPLLDLFAQENAAKSWQVLGLALDQPAAVRKFLTRTPVHFPVALAGADGLELTRAFGNLSGGLPFTVVLAAGGKVVQRRMGRITSVELEQWGRLF